MQISEDRASDGSRSPSKIITSYLTGTAAGKRGLNLGCGGETIKDWINIDEGHPHHVDVVWDLCEGLPFIQSSTFDVIYSEHFLEHIGRKSALHLMRECLRVLVPGGTVRIAMPNLDEVLRAYHANDKHPTVNESFSEEFGGAFHTKGELLNIAMRAWGHTYLYNLEDGILLLQSAGLDDVRSVPHLQSEHPLLAGRETRPPYQSSLIVEGKKPAKLGMFSSLVDRADQLLKHITPKKVPNAAVH